MFKVLCATTALIGGIIGGALYQSYKLEPQIESMVQERMIEEQTKLIQHWDCEIAFLASSIADHQDYNRFLFQSSDDPDVKPTAKRIGSALCSDFVRNGIITERMEHMKSMRKYAEEAYFRMVIEGRAETELENMERENAIIQGIHAEVVQNGGKITDDIRKRLALSLERMNTYTIDYSREQINYLNDKKEKGH